MKENLPEIDFSRSDPAGLLQVIPLVMRVAVQIVGLILIVCGAYQGLSILLFGIGFIRSPADLENTLASTTKMLNLQDADIVFGDAKLALGRTTAMLILFLWYVTCAWIAALIVSTGNKLVMGAVTERQEFLSAMKEFLITVRREGIASQPRQNDPPA